MSAELIPLNKIAHNPYQGREEYGDIETLARSIAMDGLQETPKGRHTPRGKGYQLKFGHRRAEAFRWLKDNWQAQGLPNQYDGYSVMPIEIEDLTDEQMFVGAVIENEHRKNLTPIEQARMMIAYRDQFKKTSAEVGEKFGVKGETVRGLIRLLELPEPVQASIERGEITQGQARKLLTISRVNKNEVEKAAKLLARGVNADDVVDDAFRTENAITMQYGWSNDGDARGGVGLWKLALSPEKFPWKLLPEVTVADAARALETNATETERLSEVIANLSLESPDPEITSAAVTEMVEEYPDSADLIERVAHLMYPPACTACAFHAISHRAHFCGFKACHERKKKAWIQKEMEAASKKLGIVIYNKAADGAATLPLEEYSSRPNYAAHNNWVTEKNADLRIAQHKNEYDKHKWTDSQWCRVVAVGKKATAVKEKKAKAKSQEQEKEEARQAAYAVKRARREASIQFVNQYAVRIFAALFQGMNNIAVLCALTREDRPRKDAKRADVLTSLRIALADRALDGVVGLNWDLQEKGPLAVAKFMQGVAAEWGVKLPADFLEKAKEFEPAVAVETKGRKK